MKVCKVFLALMLSLFVLCGMLSVTYASSAGITIVDVNGTEVSGTVSASDTIYVKGKAAPGDIVLLSVLNPMEEDDVLNDATMPTHLYWADDMITASDGSYSFLLDFSNCPTGSYTIRIASADGEVFDSAVQSVINDADRDVAIAAFNAAADLDEVKVLFEQQNAAHSLGLNIKAYQRLKETAAQQVYRAVFDFKNQETLTVDNLSRFNSEVFLSASALALYNQEKTGSVIEEFSTVFHLLHNESTQRTYDLIPSAEQKSAALAAITSSSYQTIADMQKAYGISVCLYAIQNAPWQSFDSIIKMNSYLFGDSLLMSQYTALATKSNVALALSGTLYTHEDFIKAFNSAVTKQAKSEQSKSAAGGGGASSSSKDRGRDSVVRASGITTSNTELEPFYDSGFWDLSQAEWARTAIEYLQEKEIIAGVAPNTFAPQNTVKREEFIKMLVLALGKYDADARCGFDDVPADSWSNSYIASAVSAGLVQGISADCFGMKQEISRQDACVILYRALSDSIEDGTPKEFTDKDEIADYAKEAVDVMSRMGLVNGLDDGSFKPNRVMTRAEAAKLLYEFCMEIGG